MFTHLDDDYQLEKFAEVPSHPSECESGEKYTEANLELECSQVQFLVITLIECHQIKLDGGNWATVYFKWEINFVLLLDVTG